MFFTLSKLLWFVLAPFNAGLILLTAAMLALYLRRRKIAQMLGVAAWGVFVVFGVLPVGQSMLLRLENWYPAPELPRRVDGIILLGGSINTDTGLARGTPQLDSTVDRITAFVELARRYPRARLVFTAGIGELDGKGTPEGAMIRQVLETYRFNPGRRLIVEDKARTTYENAILSRELVQPREGQVWLLVTSASHLPRAVGTFEKAGWPVIPVPSDYLTTGTLQPAPGHSGFLGNMTMAHIAIKEYLGIAAYALAGRWSAPGKPHDGDDAVSIVKP